jgi:TPP-dependent 2-oxoacid decarboxylase
VSAIAARLSGATFPAILVDLDAARYDLGREIMGLAEKLQAQVATIATAKGVIDETFPHYVGMYGGQASAPRVRDASPSRQSKTCTRPSALPTTP